MKPTAASPVLHHLRALGRAFRGAGRALRRGMTWFLLVAFGVCFPWLAILAVDLIGPPDSFDLVRVFGSVSSTTVHIAAHAALSVLLLVLLVQVLEGRRDISLRHLRPPAMRLLTAGAALAGADLAWTFALVAGWEDPIGDLLGFGGPNLVSLLVAVVQAWVAAAVLSAMREGWGWPWSASHLLVCGGFYFVSGIGLWTVGTGLVGWPEFLEPLLEDSGHAVPPVWWVIWRLGNGLVALVALEYLRIEPPHAPAAAEPAP